MSNSYPAQGFFLLVILAVVVGAVTNLERIGQFVPGVGNEPIEQAEISSYLSVYKPKHSSKGLTLIPLSGNAEVRLVNNRGFNVNTWNVDAVRARLVPGGSLLTLHGSSGGESRSIGVLLGIEFLSMKKMGVSSGNIFYPQRRITMYIGCQMEMY